MRSVLAVLCLLAATGVSAQSGLSVQPDRLFYQGETTFTVANTSGAAVVLDSVAVRFGYPALRAYTIRAVGPDSTYGVYYVNAAYEQSFAIGASLAAEASATLEIVGFDLCIACRQAGGYPLVDTLLVFSAGRAVADTALIDFARFVEGEAGPDPAGGFRVNVLPNPVARTLLVRVFGEAAVEVVDARGRVVWSGRTGGEAIRIDVSVWPAGVYLARTVPESRASAVARFVVVR